jgi:hypothetical protein
MKDGKWEVKDIVDGRGGSLFIAFWNNRNNVKPTDHCRTRLQYEDGSVGECAISNSHTRSTGHFIPHVDADGRIPPGITVADVKSEYNLNDV